MRKINPEDFNRFPSCLDPQIFEVEEVKYDYDYYNPFDINQMLPFPKSLNGFYLKNPWEHFYGENGKNYYLPSREEFCVQLKSLSSKDYLFFIKLFEYSVYNASKTLKIGTIGDRKLILTSLKGEKSTPHDLGLDFSFIVENQLVNPNSVSKGILYEGRELFVDRQNNIVILTSLEKDGCLEKDGFYVTRKRLI